MLVVATLIGTIIVTTYNNDFKIKEGDLLFQNLDCGPICDAIEEVTYGIDSAKFSHIGLVVNIAGKLKVLEAISNGVVITTITDFSSRSSDEEGNPKIWVGRLKPEYNSIIDNVSTAVPEVIGMEYDNEFLYDNDKYYCSELIYDLFKKANNGVPFFQLEPMTFKSISTGEMLPVWVDYYMSLGIGIPQDSLGINPAGISRSEKIDIVYIMGNLN